MRATSTKLATLAAAVVVFLSAPTAPALGAVSCSYDQAAEVLNVTADSDDFVILGAESGEIAVSDIGTPVSCSGTGAPPTVDNTGNINLFDTNASTTWLLADPEDFVPGTGTSGEIETVVALTGDGDTFALIDFDGTGDFWTLGTTGMNWSGDNDREISFVAAVDQVGFAAGDDADALTARGAQGTGSPFSGPGTFVADGGEGGDTIEGGDSGDDLVGGPGDDELAGFAGGDSLMGDEGTNDLQGGSGDDRAAYSSTAGVTVDLGIAGPQNTGVGTDTLIGIEGLEGTNQADTLIGDGEANALLGRDGNDVLDGRGGNDSLQGGPDVDTATYESAPSGVDVNLDTNTATGGAGNDTFDSNVENLIGSAFADTLVGDASNNAITALGGSDTVSALGGADTVGVRDGGPDTASCGAEVDTAIADRASVDSVNADCENVDFLPEGGDGDGNGDDGPSNEFTFGKVKKNKRKGTAKLRVEVPGPGALDLAGKGLRPHSKQAPGAGEARLKVKAKGRKKAKLNRKGKAKVRPNVTYTPTGGTANTKVKKVKLIKR